MGRRSVALAVVAALAIPATANAAPGWVPGSDEVASHENVHSPSAVVTQDLRTVVVWVQGLSVQAAMRSRGGTFGDPFEVYPGDNSFVPQYLEATALPDGDVLVTWSGPDFNYPAYAKLVHPDETVDDAVSIEAGGFHPAVAVTSAGRIALAYYTFNEVKVMARPAGSATFDPAVQLLPLSSSPAEAPNSLDVTIRNSDGLIAAAVGTKGTNPPSPAQARMLIVRRTQQGVNSTEFVDSQTMSLTVPAGQSESGQYDGQIELLSDGNPVLVYRKSHIAPNGTQTREIHGGKRTGTNGASAPIDSGNAGNFPGEHGLVVDDAGRPSVWWRNDLGADQGLRISRADTDGVFIASSQKLATSSFGPAVLEAFGNGRTGLLFTQDGKEQASTSQGGAVFGAPVVVAIPASVPAAFSKLALAGAGEGSAVAFWQDGLTSDSALNATPFDATAPTLGALQAPDALTAGVAGTFSTSALDDWSTPSIAWLFSDGATQSGPSVQHAFSTDGSFTATATATDAVGNTASAGRSVTVTPAPTPVVDTTPADDTPPAGPPPAVPAPDKTPPTVKLALTKQKLLKALKKGYFAFFFDNELGTGVADLFASGKDAKGTAAARKRVGHGTLKVTKTGKQKLVVKFTRRAKKAFNKRKKVTLSLVLVVKDAAGNATRKTAKVGLKR